ncbi:MAG: DNA polymerase III subunit gamma/tau [Bacteroidota bacterium]
MEQFIVSARKYRPSTFNTVVGQQSITTTLKNAIRTNQLAQAFLFTGPRGVGKTTCARILAKTINCSNLTAETECCNTCDSCVAFNNGQSLNIFELDAASNSSVDDMRALVEQVRYHPQGGKYRTYIIDEVHMLTTQAFNAFLKTLEEPPAYAKFILATTEKHKIIPTILSRCQIFDFNRITVNDIAEHLAYVAKSENVTADPEALHLIAQKADGALRDALSIFDQLVSYAGSHITYKHVSENLNVLDHEYYFNFTDMVVKGDLPSCLMLLDKIVKDGFNLHHFVIGFATHIRDLMMCKDPQTASLIETTNTIREQYLSQSNRLAPGLLFQFLDLLSKCDYQFQSAQNQRLHVEIALMRMCAASGRPDLTTPVRTEQPATSVTSPSIQNSFAPPSNPTTIPPGMLQQDAIAVPEIKKAAPPVSIKIENQTANIPAITPKPAASSPTRTSRSATISISKTLAVGGLGGNKSKEDEDPAMIYAGYKLDVDAAIKAIKKISDGMLEVGRKQVGLSLVSYPLEIVDENIIEIPVENLVQADEIRSNRVEILKWLRESENLKCGDIRCRILPSNEVKKTAYSPTKKFNTMTETNPMLAKLRQKLDLDLDF